MSCIGPGNPIADCDEAGQVVVIPGVTFLDGYPDEFIEDNIYMGEQGVCCPTTTYPDCTGECKTLYDPLFAMDPSLIK